MDRWQHRWAKHVRATGHERHGELPREAGVVYDRQKRESGLSWLASLRNRRVYGAYNSGNQLL
jgi:hypothetical protein